MWSLVRLVVILNKSEQAQKSNLLSNSEAGFSIGMTTSLSMYRAGGHTTLTGLKLIYDEATGIASMSENHNKGMINMTCFTMNQ